jgi:hypothetical protein
MARRIERTQSQMMRASTSMVRRGIPVWVSAGPMEGETGKPPVVDACSTSSSAILLSLLGRFVVLQSGARVVLSWISNIGAADSPAGVNHAMASA